MILTTKRLLLRDFVESDWEAVLAYQRNPLYLRYNEWTERTPEAVRDFIRMFLDHQEQEPRLKFQFAVTLKSTGQLIGNCGVRRASVDACEGDIGYELDPDHWNKGYGTEAAQAILHFGFTQMNLHRISAQCVAENIGSAHVLEKLGMQQEGRFRENLYLKDRWWDTILYAILYHEWQTRSDNLSFE